MKEQVASSRNEISTGAQFTRLERCVRYDLRAIECFLTKNNSDNKGAADSRSAAQAEVRDGHAALRP
jgi:hypothetical protein